MNRAWLVPDRWSDVRRAGNRGTRPADDAGVATVWAAFGVAALLAVTLVALDLGAAVAGRHRAEAAADLAALAAAGQAAVGEQVACERARRIARQMGGSVSWCALSGWDALVEVRVARRLTVLGDADAGPSARRTGLCRAGGRSRSAGEPRARCRQRAPA